MKKNNNKAKNVNTKELKKKASELVNKAIKINNDSSNSKKYAALKLLDEALVLFPDLIDAVYNKAVILIELYENSLIDNHNNNNNNNNNNNSNSNSNTISTNVFDFSNSNSNIDFILLEEALKLLLKVISLDTSKRSETLGLAYRSLSLLILQYYDRNNNDIIQQYKHILNINTFYDAINVSMKYFNNTITILSNDKHLDEMILEYSQELSSSLHKSLTSTNSSNDDNNNVNMLIEITLNALELMDHAFQTNYSNDVDIGIFSTKADTITIVFDTIFNTNSNSNNNANTDTRVIIPLYEKSLELANTMIQLGQDDDIELISLACDIYEKLIKANSNNDNDTNGLINKLLSFRLSCFKSPNLSSKEIATVCADIGDTLMFLSNYNHNDISINTNDASILNIEIIKYVIICSNIDVGMFKFISKEEFESKRCHDIDNFINYTNNNNDDDNNDKYHSFLMMALLCYEIATILTIETAKNNVVTKGNEKISIDINNNADDDDDDDDDDGDDDTFIFDVIYNISCIHYKIKNYDPCFDAITTLISMNTNSNNDNHQLYNDICNDEDFNGIQDNVKFKALFQ